MFISRDVLPVDTIYDAPDARMTHPVEPPQLLIGYSTLCIQSTDLDDIGFSEFRASMEFTSQMRLTPLLNLVIHVTLRVPLLQMIRSNALGVITAMVDLLPRGDRTMNTLPHPSMSPHLLPIGFEPPITITVAMRRPLKAPAQPRAVRWDGSTDVDLTPEPTLDGMIPVVTTLTGVLPITVLAETHTHSSYHIEAA